MEQLNTGYDDVANVKLRAKTLIDAINQIELSNAASIRTRAYLENSINQLVEQNIKSKEALDIATHAIEILRQVSDEAVSQAYGFLEQSLNAALARMFANTTRKIRIREYTRNGQYPQLELELDVGNGITRSLKSDSGHGLAQIVSLLSILSLIVITNSRRLMVMDEIISGLSVHNRKIVSDILWSFTEIGFQFIVNDHGFIPEGSKVYHLEMVGDVSHVKDTYIAKKGIYLQGDEDASKASKTGIEDNTEEDKDDSFNMLDSTNQKKDSTESVESIANVPESGTDIDGVVSI